MTRRPAAAAAAAALSVLWWLAAEVAAQVPPPKPAPAAWVVLDGCRWIDHPSNDGDSFRIGHGGRTYTIRLYFVDTPETEDFKDLRQRITDQRKYWGITRAQLFRVAEEAGAFAKDALAAPFTVTTRWEDARGAGTEPRYFGFVETRHGDLAELLVSAGLARMYGHEVDHPKGVPARNIKRRLEQLESEAKAAGRGAWGVSATPTPSPSKSGGKSSSKPRPTPTPSRPELPAF